MYPKVFVDYFRQFDRKPEVFVAMPMSKDFEPRWRNIFKPAIRRCGLKPYRVDLRLVSDSILMDILEGIGRAQFVLVDVSPQKDGWPNPNVMYELGLAHAIRLPEEVIVVRDSNRSVSAPFDVSHIRWNAFDPERVTAAQKTIWSLFKVAQHEIDLTKDILIQQTVRSLDPDMIAFINDVRDTEWFDLAWFDEDRKGIYTLGQRDSSEAELKTIARLLMERGILEGGEDTGFHGLVGYGVERLYVLTPLGRSLLDKLPTPPKFKNQAEHWRWAMARYKQRFPKNELRKRINRRKAG